MITKGLRFSVSLTKYKICESEGKIGIVGGEEYVTHRIFSLLFYRIDVFENCFRLDKRRYR